jgi:phosphoglycerol transferase MdoB-like AlkP superfamily enzyme
MHIGSVKIIVATSLVLSLFLVLLRSSVTGQCWDLYLHPVMSFPKVLWAGFYDVMFVMITGCLFLFLSKFFAHKERAGKIIIGSFIFVSFLSLLAGILNVQVVQIIGKPFNYPWFYYSDFLQSSDAKSAVASNISSSYILQVIMVCVSAFLLIMMFIVIADMMVRKLRMKGPIISTLVCCSAVYITIAPDAIDNYKWDYDKLSNPVVAFAASANPFSEEPQLFTMSVSDTLQFDIFKNKQAPASKPIPSIKNVIVFVMESTPAEYIQPYSSSYKLTPELEKYLPQSVVFENVYAHAPSTNNSMVSILGSSYPWLTYNSVTMEHPDIGLQTISSELKRKGYRTGFFNSADNRFQKAGEFLSNRKFDAIKDYNNVQCQGNFEVKDDHWDYLNGKDDECTADDMITWIKQNSSQPFFSMMWTYQTHYPYFATGDEKKYSQDEILNRYLNAVNHSDKVLGKLLDELKQAGLSESTLVVVVGDHGEAFGRHGQTHHASKIYEENLHVPCIFINPAFKGEHKQGIGGLIDIAPTIMNTLGFSSPEMWHGKDLFTATENDRVYFFTPWSDYLFGYREGNMKYIFNATKNSTEMYDLKNDPFEENNIAAEYPESAELSHQRIAGWVQSVNKFMGNLLATHKNAN